MRQITPFIGQHLIKVLTGQRRAGQSYILYELMDTIRRRNPDANIVYINMEFSEFQTIEDQKELYARVNERLTTADNYVFIDEIQEVNGFERTLQALFAEERCDLYVTGSNSHLLSGDLSTYLAGRCIQFQVHPLSYREFLDFNHWDNTTERLRLYLERGGMPYLPALSTLPNSGLLAEQYLRNLHEAILLRDVVARANIRNVRFLENLSTYLSDNTGNIFSATNISKYLKNQRQNIPVPTVISYLSALEQAMLVHSVPRAEVNGLKIFEIGEKYYFEDLGLRNILARARFPAGIEKLVENAVYLHLIQQQWTVYIGKVDVREVDFAAVKGGCKIYLQAAYRLDSTETREREFGSLLAITDAFPRMVVSLDEDTPAVTPEGIRCMHLKDFLTDGMDKVI
jgi:predicted AAA+ superfamily ATPase